MRMVGLRGFLPVCLVLALLSRGSCKHVYLHELDQTFEEHKASKGYTVIYIFDDQFRTIAHNLVANLYSHNITNTIGAVKDKEECQTLESFIEDDQIVCSSADPAQYPDFADVADYLFVSDAFLIGKNFMYFFVIHALRAGLDVLYVDTDVVFHTSPDQLVHHLSLTTDIALKLQYSYPRYDMNAGVFYARASEKCLSVIEDTWDRIINETRKQHRREKSHNFEQQLFTDAIETKLGDKYSMRLQWDQQFNKQWHLGIGNFDPEATKRMAYTADKRVPVTYNNFTLLVVPDNMIGWKEDLVKVYKNARSKNTTPQANDMAVVTHVRGNGGKTYDKVRWLQLLHYWDSRIKDVGRDVQPGKLVRVGFTGK
eukprot:gene17411-20721_t